MTGIDLAKRLDKKVELVSVYDPYLHYAVFKGIVEVLTDEAAKVFRFEEQNQLHEEIIDTGLADIYQSHLNMGASIAKDAGVEVTKTLLDGKAFQKVLDRAREIEPYLLIIGKVGVHTDDADGGVGSNTENLLRMAPCDVLLTTRRETPELDLKAEESIHWTPEAEGRMTRVPEQVLGIARTAILRLALEKGHSVVTSDLVTEAMERFMPGASQRRRPPSWPRPWRFERVSPPTEPTSAGSAATVALVADPEKCASCGRATEFDALTPEMLDEIAAAEGGTEEETTYDGRKLRWTQDARKALRSLGDNYQRRRAKARIEKSARGKRVGHRHPGAGETIHRRGDRRALPCGRKATKRCPRPTNVGRRKARRLPRSRRSKSPWTISELKILARDRKKQATALAPALEREGDRARPARPRWLHARPPPRTAIEELAGERGIRSDVRPRAGGGRHRLRPRADEGHDRRLRRCVAGDEGPGR